MAALFVPAIADTILAYFYVLGISRVYILFNTLTSTSKLVGGGRRNKEGRGNKKNKGGKTA